MRAVIGYGRGPHADPPPAPVRDQAACTTSAKGAQPSYTKRRAEEPKLARVGEGLTPQLRFTNVRADGPQRVRRTTSGQR